MHRLYLLCFLTFLCTSVRAQKTMELPNVVIILADDVGPGDLSGYRRLNGGKFIVDPPNLDQLMSTGTAFTDAHSPSALCAPSRCRR